MINLFVIEVKDVGPVLSCISISMYVKVCEAIYLRDFLVTQSKNVLPDGIGPNMTVAANHRNEKLDYSNDEGAWAFAGWASTVVM